MIDLPRRVLAESDAVRVRSSRLFIFLPRDALAQILAQAWVITAPPNTSLFEQGGEAKHLLVVVNGVVGLMAAVGARTSCLIELVGSGQVVVIHPP
ncbi:MAG: hypothetical protein WCO00_12500 [Rhodospirillaceae bacterium]